MFNSIVLNSVVYDSVVFDSVLFDCVVFRCAAMEELDGDEVRVSFKGRLAERDIVQVNTRRLFTITYLV